MILDDLRTTQKLDFEYKTDFLSLERVEVVSSKTRLIIQNQESSCWLVNKKKVASVSVWKNRARLR